MGEFNLIELIRHAARSSDPDVVTGIGDDAAILEMPPGYQLVASTDSLNEGIHFPAGTSAHYVGHKSLAVNLSDLAAMGARPRWFLLNLSMPEPDAHWVREFMEGLMGLASQHGVCLVGGDTCSGPLSISVTVLGLVEAGFGLKRTGARPGDLVAVSGTLGDAACALGLVAAGENVSVEILKSLHQPVPRVSLGLALVGKASSCIDISDGLLADLGHVCRASGCGAVIELEAMPASEALMGFNARQRWSLQLGGGDDYELCFTLRDEKLLPEIEKQSDVRIKVIGRMVSAAGIQCIEPGGQVFEPVRHGFQHFTRNAG